MAAKHMRPLLELGQDELTDHLEELREEMFNLKFRNKMRQLDNSLKIRHLRRQIARANTLLTRLEMESEQESTK